MPRPETSGGKPDFIRKPVAGAKPPMRVIWALHGSEYSGKTTWCLRAALGGGGPLLYVSSDPGREGVFERFMEENSEAEIDTAFVDCRVPVEIRVGAAFGKNEEHSKKVKMLADEAFRKKRKAFDYGIGKYRTIVDDTFTETWDWLRLARFGRKERVDQNRYTEVNTEMKGWVSSFSHQKTTNIILLHREVEEYKDVQDSKGNQKSKATGKMKREGFKHIGPLVHAQLRTVFDKKTDAFSLEIVDTRRNKQYVGEEVEIDYEAGQGDYAHIASLLIPEYSEKKWRRNGLIEG
jgi:hypothetical protein